MNIINSQTDVLMLAALRGSQSAGVYHAAARGAELVAFSLIIVNFTIQPVISRLHASGELARLERIAKAGAWAALALSLPIAFVLVIFGGPVLEFVFGPEFRRGAVCLAILCIAHVINAALGPADHVLNMTGYERDTAMSMAVAAVANVLLNGALIPIWDVEGAAIASGLSVVLWKVILAARVHHRLGISAVALARPRQVR
jgi:O-antigen/teichoic acid export membrane protein